jgi:carboxyl-terminal processing protease
MAGSKKRRWKGFVLTFAGLVFLLGTLATVRGAASQTFEYLELFSKVLHFIQTNYVEEVDTKKLIEGAIKGMLSTLDPHSLYLPPDQYREMQVDTSGKFFGLGIEITVSDGYLTVVTPIEDTPAFYAGIEPGDRILAIEDKGKKLKRETKGMTLIEAVNMMRGEKGTKVILHVGRKGQDRLLPIEVTRDVIKVVSVKGGLLERDFAWLRVTSFQANTARDLRKKLETLIKENQRPLRGIVLDLRSNPGGLLEEAIAVASLFLENRLPVVSTMGRAKAKKEIEYSRSEKPFRNEHLVVLVNEASASASEIVAGALQDHKRGLVVGKTTFGKGSVQTVMDLENKAGLKLTVARYYTPNGRSIQSKGIVPDIEVERIETALLEKARKGKATREADLEGHLAGENETPAPDQDETEKVTKSLKDLANEGPDALRRPVREKAGRKLRVDDPKELLKNDFQLQQSLSYLKAWDVFAPESSSKKAADEVGRNISGGAK